MKKNYFWPSIIFFLTLWVQSGFSQKPQLVVQVGHTQPVVAIDLSPDEQTLASGSHDFSVLLWDNANGNVKLILEGHEDAVTDVEFSPDGKFLASAGMDEKIIIWDLGKARMETILPGLENTINSISFHPDGKLVAGALFDGKIAIWDLEKKSLIKQFKAHRKDVTSIDFSPNGQFLASGSEDRNVIIWDTKNWKKVTTLKKHLDDVNHVEFSPLGSYLLSCGGFDDQRILVWNTKDWSLKKSLHGHGQSVQTATFDPAERFVASGSCYDESEIYVWDLNSASIRSMIRAHGDNVNSLVFNGEGNLLFSGSSDKSIKLWNMEDFLEIPFFIKRPLRVKEIVLDQSEENLFAAYEDGTIRVWDLANGKPYLFLGGHEKKITGIENSDNENIFLSCSEDGAIVLWEKKTGKLKEVINDQRDGAAAISLSSDGKMLLSGGYGGNLVCRDLERGEVVFRYTEMIPVVEVGFSPNQELIAWAGFGGDVKVYNLEKEQMVFEFACGATLLSGLNFSPDSRFLLTAGGFGRTMELWDLKSGDLVQNFGQFDGMVTAVTFNSEGDKLAVGLGNLLGSSPEILLFETETGKEIHRWEAHQDVINSVKFSKDGAFLYSASDDAQIKMWELKNENLVLSMIVQEDLEDFIAFTGESYYKSSKSGLDCVAFRYKNRLYPYKQFDIFFNRPDLVLEQLKGADPDMIEDYYKAFLKRAQKMGIHGLQENENWDLPECIIENKAQFSPVSEGSELTLQIKARDEKSNLIVLHIWVNGVPLYGFKGTAVLPIAASYSNKVQLTLTPGKNRIEVAVENENGIQSLKESMDIRYTPKTREKPDLYVFAIGISKYKDASRNLQYAAKDAQDLVDIFDGSDLYKSKHLKLVQNEMAIKDSIFTFEHLLNQTKPEDHVIVLFSGHGMRDLDRNYYFCTHDIDPENPKEKGMTFEEFESIIDSIPARNKLVLIDACHSGEFDEEGPENSHVDPKQTVEGKVLSRKTKNFTPVGGVGRKIQSPFELMKEYFVDLRLGSGASVIASSSGRDISLESEDWKNGVFTFAVLNGLKTGAADLDQDGETRVSELRNYVEEKVLELTEDSQNPVNRQENIENDFVIW